MAERLHGVRTKFQEALSLLDSGDSDAALNLLIDAYDGVWVIDPAHLSRESPPFSDYAKLETCFTFEAVTLPMVEEDGLHGCVEEKWSKLWQTYAGTEEEMLQLLPPTLRITSPRTPTQLRLARLHARTTRT